MGFIDIQNIGENNICDVNYEIKNMQIRPNPPEDHSIYIEIEIEQTCMVFEKKEIKLIQDLYSPTKQLEFSQKRISSRAEKTDLTKQFTIKDNIQIQGLEQENFLDVEAMPNITNVDITNSKIKYTGEINLNFIFSTENSIHSKISKIPFEVLEENITQAENIDIVPEMSIKNTTFEVKQEGNVDIQLETEIQTKISKNVNMNIIDNIEIVEELPENQNEDYDSLILYIVKSGDTLWQIAKRFNSTVDELVRMNGIEDSSKINIGQKIYIPKFNRVRKENRENARETVSV